MYIYNVFIMYMFYVYIYVITYIAYNVKISLYVQK